jgi:hypothetical protein
MIPWIIVVGAAGLLFLALISAIVAYQARQRGYAFFPWLIAGMLANPIFFLVLLAVMPDYARKVRRRKYLAELESKLAGHSKVLSATPRVPISPRAGKALAVAPERSIGDLPTVDPPERSLGDEETHA